MKKNLKMKLSRAAMTLLLLLVNSTITWADDNQFVISYMHDPQFDTESYGTYKHTRCEPVELWEAPSKEGYTFLHWFGYWTKQDGSQAFNNFPAEATLGTDITCNISYSYPFMTLQAVFTANSYTLTFDANGGTGAEMADVPMTYNQSHALPACTYSKSGAVFMGWTTHADGTGYFFYDGETVKNMTTEQNGTVTLYAQYFETTGTADNPYLIGNEPTWNILAGRVNKGIDSYKYYKMTADITTGRMMGTTTAYPFNGHFDGNGHSLRFEGDFNFDDMENGTYAPFRYVKNATFMNLYITSYISFSGYKPSNVSAGGCVGAVMPQGEVNFVACHSSATSYFLWTSDINGDRRGGSFGGFVSFLSANSSATFLDCLSSAQVHWYPYQVGYFIGVAEAGSTASFTNCHESTAKFPFSYYTEEGLKRFYVPQYPFVALPTDVNETYTNCWRNMCDDCDMLENEPTGTYAHQGTYIDTQYTTVNNATLRNNLGNGWIQKQYTVEPRIPANTNSITISSDIVHGTVKCLASTAPGETVMLEVTSEEGYHITSVTYNDGSDHNATLRDGKYWFTMPSSNVTVSATFAVNSNATPYVAYNTETCVYETKYFSSVTNVTSSSTTLGTSGQEKKYVVTGNVTVSDRIYVNGTVHLVLADGATLTANKGINVHSGNSLIVYGQEGGTGVLKATGSQFMDGSNWESAAIGSDGNGNGDVRANLGDLTFHSGVVNATAYEYASAIGGGHYNPACGSITLYGGTITATATEPGAYNQEAIGHGTSGGNVSKTIIDGLRMYTNNSETPVSYNDRIGALGQKIVRVERCTEHNYQSGRCTYCGAYEYHQITYYGNGNTGGTAPAVATCNVTTGIHTATGTIAEAGDMERTGYTFAGWNTEVDGSGTAYEPGATITFRSDLTLYARWTLDEYAITYNLDGGTLPEGESNPTTYTVESDEIILVNPTREGYAFVGWTGTDLDAATEDVTIYSGSSGNREYTATWLGLPPEVSLVKNSLTPYGATVKWTGSSESYTLQYAEGNPFTVLFSEGFEGGSLPDGWTTIGSYWAVGSGTGYEDYTVAATGNYNATCFYNGQSEEDNYLITPVLDLSGVTSATLTFNYRNVAWGSDLNVLHVYYRVDGGSWNELDNYTTEVFDWTLVTIPLKGLAPDYQIGFKCDMNYGYGMGIDDVQVLTDDPNFAWTTVDNAHSPYTFDNLELETRYSVRVIGVTEGQLNKVSNLLSITTLERYPKPFGLDIVDNTLTAHSATVSWKGFSDSYNIRLGEDNSIVNADFETGDLNQAEFTTTTTNYPWTVVENGHSGSWCAKSTNEDCNDSESDMVLEVTLPTDLTLTFSAKVSSEEGYDKAYFSIDGVDKIDDGISGDGDWIDYAYPLTAGTHTLCWYYTKDSSASDNDDCFYVDDIRIADGMTVLNTYTSNTTNYNFTDLDAEKTYLVQVQGVSESVTTDWSEPYAFTTATSCPKPTDLTAGTPDAHSVELSWTENGTATQWQICVNGDMSNLTTVSTNPYILSGLSGDTEYTVKVRAYNNADEQSRWSNEVTFTTDISCFAPTDLAIGAISSRSVELSWTENGSSNKWVIEYSNDDEFTDAQSVVVTGTPSHTLTALTSGYSYYARVRAINSDNELSRWSEYVCFDAKQVIGDGSDTNDNLPLNTDRKYSLSQQIYTASELGEAGFIESIDFYADCYATRNIDIYMVSTSKSSFESGTDWVTVTASDLVFSGEVQFNNDGWKAITLDRYFEYDGTHNIVLVVDDNTGSDTWNYYHAFRVFDATSQAIYVNGSSDFDPFNPSSGTVLNVKNQIRLAISVSPKPTDVTVSDIAATSATISWNGEGGNYNVKYREATVSSTWLSDALFFENFEDDLGEWTSYAEGYSGSSTNWQQKNPRTDTQTFQYISAYSRNYVAMSRSKDAYGTARSVDNWLVSPQMTLGDVLKFHAHDDGTHHEHFEVYVSTKTKAISDFEKVADPSIGNGSWNEIIVDLSAYAGQEGYIAIRHNDTGKNFLFIDDFGVYETVYDYTYGTETTLTSTTNSCELTGLSAGTIYEVQVQADGGSDGTSQWSSPMMFTTSFDLILANGADNDDAISKAAANGGEFNVTLANRTLYKDCDWNTLCLPFNLTIAGSPLDGDGVEVRTLSEAGFDDGTLTLTFTAEGDVTELVAGTPYIIKWTGGSNLTETDLVFSGVTVDATMRNKVCDLGDGKSISFVGTYSPVIYNDENRSVLFLGGSSTLYYPDGTAPTTIGTCRAYFTLNGITAGDPTNGVRQFVLNFGDKETGICDATRLNDKGQMINDNWYSLDGRRLNGKPTASGVYINNGHKVVIK